ncbi:copper chaperone PCu(A)C [Hyphococcus sp.]|jgi:hypothetical protein|uniref:copper chaperone PCu(A)C n=1 Tax=Hyphococcus sp. TaxID=2038636 RepID=UPI003D140A6A
MHILRKLSLAVAISLASCAAEETSVCADDGITAGNAWLRAAGEGAAMSAAYVELCNGADAADRLIAARFDGANAVEIHMTKMSDDGVASMAPAANGVELPPHEMTSLAPGGAHIMLIGISAPIEEGEEAAITLEFENAAPVTLMFEARSRTDASGHAGH